MKKFFNYALLAAALLVGVNVNAATVKVSDVANLQEAINKANSGDVIQLTTGGTTVNYSQTLYMDREGVDLTLDLNGRDLVFNNPNAASAPKATAFILYKGILRVKGGNVINETDVTKGTYNANPGGGTVRCFYVLGEASRCSTAFAEDAKKEQKLAAYKTQLWLADDVFVDCSNGKNGIELIHETAALDNHDGVSNKDNNKGAAYGAFISIAGQVHGEKYGIQVSGNIAVVPGEGEDARDYNYPWFVVEKTAEVYSNAETTVQGGVGIYMGGFGILDIYGYVHGATGVYVKNGDVEIKDAVIASDYSGEFKPAWNGASSTEGGGSAVVIVTNGNTYGNIDVTIGGDTKITGGSGYGIEEDVNVGGAGEGTSKIDALNIEGGTIENGKEGGIVIQDETQTKLEVTGGTSGGTINVGKAGEGTSEVGIDTFVPKDGENKGHVTVITNEDGTTTTVVTKGEKPTEATLTDANSIMTYANQSINFNGSEVAQVLNDDLKLKELVMNSADKAEKLTVPDGKTLRVEKLLMGAKANITVAKGGTLIVDGEQGIVANAAGNIVIQAQEKQMGQFLFNPAVTSNRHPVATLTYYSKAFRNSAEHQQQDLIGIPMNAVSNITISDNSKSIVFDVWRKTYWDRIGGINFTPSLADNYAKFDVPFGLYCMYSNTDSEHLLSCNITGNLLGNTEPSSIHVLKGWTSAANSWTGDIDFDAIIKALNDNHFNGLTKSIYLGTIAGSAITWNAFNESTDNNPTVVEPMQAMMLSNTGANAVDARILTYKELVWDPVMETEPATPSAPRATQNINKVSVRISSQEGVTDRVIVGEMDADYSAPKYMENPVCVYAHADENYDIFATSAIENTFIGFNTNKAGIYTVSFGKVNGNYALVDNKTNARIAMAEGTTYEFLAEAGEDAYRFQIVAGAQAPTDMEKTNAAVKANKALINGQIVISNGERFFNVLGADVK